MSRQRRGGSGRWLREHETDAHVRRARQAGLRSRAAFKLEELDRRDHLVRPGHFIVDLGAAPGSWSQYLARRWGDRVRIIALDRLPMAPIQGVEVIQGDFLDAAVGQALTRSLAGRQVDLVLSDMAPNISGVAIADQAAGAALAEAALNFAAQALRPGGDLLVKLFQGEGFDAVLKSLRERFARMAIRKPGASRSRSREVYVLAREFRVV